MFRLTLLLSVCSLSLCAFSAHAQETDTDLYDGKWTVRLQSSEGGYAAGRLVIANFGGSFQDMTGKRGSIHKACHGKKFPVTVQRSTSSIMEFTVWGSSVSPSCPDLSISLKPTSDKVLEGTVNAAGSIRLSRQ